MKGRPGTCGVCEHPRVDEIDRLLIKLDAGRLKCPWCSREFGSHRGRNLHLHHCNEGGNSELMTWKSVGKRFGFTRNTLVKHFREHVGDVKPKSTGTPKRLLGPREMTAKRADEIAAAISSGWR